MNKFTKILLNSVCSFALCACAVPAEARHRGNPVAVTPPPPTPTIRVVSTCAQPPSTYAGTKRYINANTGNDSNAGTIGSPWRTFTHVTDGTTVATDEVLLYSGNYGDVSFTNIVFANFIHITNVAGNTPIIASVNLAGSKKIVFEGIKFQSTLHGNGVLAQVKGDVSNTSQNIVFYNNQLSSIDDSSGWSHANWTALAEEAFFVDGGDPAVISYTTCTTINSNQIKNVIVGISFTADKTMVDGNTLDLFGPDAIDVNGNLNEVSHNTITNPQDVSGLNHNDAIQMQIGRCNTGCLYTGLILNGNVYVEQTRVTPFPTTGGADATMGFDIFDADWTNVTWINNIVANSTTNAMYLASVHNADVGNNVIWDMAGNGSELTIWDLTHAGEGGTQSSNVHVWNNIVSNLGNNFFSASLTWDHNLVFTRIAWWYPGSSQITTTPGNYGDGTTILTATAGSAVFTSVNNVTHTYDFHLIPAGLGVGTGVAPAPLKADGTTRTAPVDKGAY